MSGERIFKCPLCHTLITATSEEMFELIEELAEASHMRCGEEEYKWGRKDVN